MAVGECEADADLLSEFLLLLRTNFQGPASQSPNRANAILASLI